MLLKILFTILISINLCFAIDVTPIKKGTPAPEDGFFIDNDNIKKMRKINEEKALLEKETIKLEQLRITNESVNKIYKTQLEDASKEVTKQQVKGDLKGVFGFLLGVVATSVAAFAAVKVLEKR